LSVEARDSQSLCCCEPSAALGGKENLCICILAVCQTWHRWRKTTCAAEAWLRCGGRATATVMQCTCGPGGNGTLSEPVSSASDDYCSTLPRASVCYWHCCGANRQATCTRGRNGESVSLRCYCGPAADSATKHKMAQSAGGPAPRGSDSCHA